jgi:hypothetical protein
MAACVLFIPHLAFTVLHILLLVRCSKYTVHQVQVNLVMGWDLVHGSR